MSLFPPLPKQNYYLLIIGAPDGAVDYAPDGAVDYAPDGAVDYAPDGAVDYVASPLWIMGFALWITRAVLAVDFPALRARAHISAPAVMWSSGRAGMIVYP